MNMLSFVDRFIPEKYRRDPAEYSRAKNIVGCSLVLLPAGVIFSLVFVIFKLPSGVVITLAATSSYTALPFLVRSGKSLYAIGVVAVLILLGLFTSLTFIQGGLTAACVTWFPLVPVMASFLNGVKSGVRWVVITALVVTAMQLMHMAGFTFPTANFSAADSITLLGSGITGSILAIGLITATSESMKKKAFEEMAKSKEETESALRNQETMARRLEEDKIKLRASEEKLSEQKKYLSDSIDLMLKEMNRFAGGDLTVELKNEKNDEIGKLFDGFNYSVKHISELVTNIQNAVQAAASTSTELSSSSEEMASGVQEQSQKTEEVAASVAEIAENINKSSEYASRAAESSSLASQRANDGAQQVLLTKQGIEKIAGSAKETAVVISSLTKKTDQIGEIIQVIDDIADQTNLLALNAAIEAARAGEQGRGFAVVADEVRKLAERTTKATKEIADTIKAIQTEAKEADSSMVKAEGAVEEGLRLSERVSGAFSQIIEANESVLGLVSQLAQGGKEQAQSAANVIRNIEAMTSISAQSASGTEQIAHASMDLNRLTLNLQDLISKFKIENTKEMDHYLLS
ncbi:MAG TPA: methyl-accepting chemotaxis protein [Ignavibacteriales bacterium]|nr:methyl-accepting chemotaxis protein [Ignavibacteriales bacterium]